MDSEKILNKKQGMTCITLNPIHMPIPVLCAGLGRKTLSCPVLSCPGSIHPSVRPSFHPNPMVPQA